MQSPVLGAGTSILWLTTGGVFAGGGSFLDDAADAFLAQGIAPNDPMGFEQRHPAATVGADGRTADASESSDAADSGAELDNDYKPKRRRRRALVPAGRQRKSVAKARPASAAARGKAAAAEPVVPVVNLCTVPAPSLSDKRSARDQLQAHCLCNLDCAEQRHTERNFEVFHNDEYVCPRGIACSQAPAPEGLFKPGGRGAVAQMLKRKQQLQQQRQQAQPQPQLQAAPPPLQGQKTPAAEATRLQGLLQQELGLQVLPSALP
jgi:hypothetical protein